MSPQEIEAKVRNLQSELGGTIFAFPIDEFDPVSKYAVVTLFKGNFVAFPKFLTVEEAAAGIVTLSEGLQEQGMPFNYERDVRFISYESQINGPSVTMRRLKKHGEFEQPKRSPFLETGSDILKQENEDGYLFSGRGLVKFSYLTMTDDETPKAVQFMDNYYKLLAARKYGKTASAIKRIVRRMKKDEAIRWIERTYAQFVHDDAEIIAFMKQT